MWAVAMFVVLDTEDIIPCRYDQGRDLYVIDKFEIDHDDVENIVAIVDDGQHFPVCFAEVIETTRRVYFVEIDFEDDDDEDSDEGDTSDEEETDSDEEYCFEDSTSEGESSYGEFDDPDDILEEPYLQGMPKYLFEPEF